MQDQIKTGEDRAACVELSEKFRFWCQNKLGSELIEVPAFQCIPTLIWYQSSVRWSNKSNVLRKKDGKEPPVTITVKNCTRGKKPPRPLGNVFKSKTHEFHNDEIKLKFSFIETLKEKHFAFNVYILYY